MKWFEWSSVCTQLDVVPIKTVKMRSRFLPWCMLSIVVATQFILFRRQVLHEVAWAYPAHVDQAIYLEHAYETYHRMRQVGLLHGLAYGAGFEGGTTSHSSAIFQLEAATLFWFVGPSRLAALTVNFIHFALFELFFVFCLRSISRRWSTALIGLGLLMSARTTFQDPGGITDFRMDFSAFCLFGMYLGAVVLSHYFKHLSWSLVAGALAAYTIAIRFITAAYFALILMAAVVIIAASVIHQPTRQRILHRLRNLCISTAIAIVAVLPAIMITGTPSRLIMLNIMLLVPHDMYEQDSLGSPTAGKRSCFIPSRSYCTTAVW